jgi:hypothetical protein
MTIGSTFAYPSRVGAGESQGRIQSTIQHYQPKDRKVTAEDVGAAALQLIRSAVTDSISGTTGRDLDVLA